MDNNLILFTILKKGSVDDLQILQFQRRIDRNK